VGGNTSRNGFLAVNGPTTPQLRWVGSRNANIGFPIAIEGSRLVTTRWGAGPNVLDSLIVVHDVETGQEIWSRDLPPDPSQTFRAHAVGMRDGLVYASRAGFGRAGPLYALDVADGSTRWKTTVDIDDDEESGAAFADDGDPIIGNFDSVMRFERSTGALVWRAPRSGPDSGGSTPVVRGSRTYIWDVSAAFGMGITVLDTATGARLYQAQVQPCPACTQQTGLFAGPDGTVYAPRTNTIGANELVAFTDTGTALQVKWRAPLGDVGFASFGVGPDGSVYSYSDDFRIVRLSPVDGSVLATSADPLTSGTVFFFPRIAIDAAGLIYVTNGVQDSRLFSFNPDLTLRWTDTIPDVQFGGPALSASGFLFVAGSGNNLRAYQTAGVSVLDAEAVEGDDGTSGLLFMVSMPSPAAAPVTVDFATADLTATADDYQPLSGTLTFAPGTSIASVFVRIRGDLLIEGPETVGLRLSSPAGAVVADGEGVGTIVDDDPKASIEDCFVPEGDQGLSPCWATIVLSGAASFPVTLDYRTLGGSATAGVDYVAASGSVTFAPGETRVPVPFQVMGDTLVEIDESFLVSIDNIAGAFAGDTYAWATIVEDDAPSLSSLELIHGSDERRALVPPRPGSVPQTYFRLRQDPHSSYEVLADELSGEVRPLLLVRLGADNVSVYQEAVNLGTGPARTLSWENNTSAPTSNQHIRVGIEGCGAGCTQAGGYRLRVFDTTLRGARFNNTGAQRTIAILHNTSDQVVHGTLWFWDQDGGLRHSRVFILFPRSTQILDTAALGILAGRSGSLTVSHVGRHGTLVGKAVIVDPVGGFSFDSPLLPRER
jgi:outer membrane protein assembly factor BamB